MRALNSRSYVITLGKSFFSNYCKFCLHWPGSFFSRSFHLQVSLFLYNVLYNVPRTLNKRYRAITNHLAIRNLHSLHLRLPQAPKSYSACHSLRSPLHHLSDSSVRHTNRHCSISRIFQSEFGDQRARRTLWKRFSLLGRYKLSRDHVIA